MSSFNKAEWLAALALMLNVLTIAFSAGILYSTQEAHSRQISDLEAKTDDLAPKVERIDANVTFLIELAREQRNGDRDK